MNEIEQRFQQFHADNPQVYELFDRFTREVIRRGYKRFSSDAILHRIRWETSVVTTDRQFKINDHYTAYYARLWMQNNPQYDGFFSLRSIKEAA